MIQYVPANGPVYEVTVHLSCTLLHASVSQTGRRALARTFYRITQHDGSNISTGDFGFQVTMDHAEDAMQWLLDAHDLVQSGIAPQGAEVSDDCPLIEMLEPED